MFTVDGAAVSFLLQFGSSFRAAALFLTRAAPSPTFPVTLPTDGSCARVAPAPEHSRAYNPVVSRFPRA